MINEEHVKTIYPSAKCVTRAQHLLWYHAANILALSYEQWTDRFRTPKHLIYDKNTREILGKGPTSPKAWNSAWKTILKNMVEKLEL